MCRGLLGMYLISVPLTSLCCGTDLEVYIKAIPLYNFCKSRMDPLTVAVLCGRFDLEAIAKERFRRGAIQWNWSIFGGLFVIVGEHPAKWLLIQEKDNIFSG